MGSVSVKHGHTIQKKEGVRGSVCDEEAGVCVRSGGEVVGGLQTSEGPRGPSGSPQQHWPCQRMPVIRWPTAVIRQLSSATQQPPSIVRDGGGNQGAVGGGASGGRGSSGGRNVPFSAAAIVLRSQLHFSDLLCAPVDSGY